ncbi:MAG TPA: IS110 family transposase [Phaeodactylibacter sp.]|nr:IS110 family transposase [Phaeodactylibacter sp.]
MQIIKQNVGIDVDSKELKVSLQMLNSDLSIKVKGSRKFKNTLKGFEALKEWSNKRRAKDLVLNVTMEATGVYYENLAYYFEEQDDYKVHVVLPNTSNAYMKSLNLKSKTDEIDAKALGQMGLERKLDTWQPISTQMRDLKKLVRERLRLSREKTMISNQLHAESASYCPSTTAFARYKKRIFFINEQIKEIEKELQQVINKDEELKERIESVCTAKGIRMITAVGIIAEFNGFILFKNRNQIVSYAGYDVIKNESGTSIRGKTKMSKKGNSYVRQILYMPAMSAAVNDEHHKAYYLRIVSKTGIKMKGNVAIQRKLLLLIYTLFTNNVEYNAKHYLIVQKRLEKKEPKIKNQIKAKQLV